jgi:hypothetical protein
MKPTVNGLLAAGAAAEAAPEAAGAGASSVFLLQLTSEASVTSKAKLEIKARRGPEAGRAEEILCMNSILSLTVFLVLFAGESPCNCC